MRKNIIALGILLLFISCISSFAQETPPVSTLSNGLEVISSNFSGETAAACLFIKTGTASEPEGKSGITSLLCSSILSCNPVGNGNPPSLTIEQVGGKVTADVESGYTCFTVVSPAVGFPAVLQALSEIISSQYFTDAAIQVERDALIAKDYAGQDSPEERMYSAAFPSAVPEDIKKISRNDLTAWRTAQFRPDRALISICGPFTNKAAVKMAEDAFKDWAGSRKPYRQETRAIAPKPEDAPAIDSKPGTAGAFFAFDFPSPGTPEYGPALVASAILSDGMSSKVFKCLRGNSPTAYQFGSALRWRSASPVMTVYAVTDENSSGAAVEGIKSSVNAVIEGRFTPEEFERGKAFALSDTGFSVESAEGTAWFNGICGISGAGQDYDDKLATQFLKVNRDDVIKAAEKYLKSYTLITMGPRNEQ